MPFPSRYAVSVFCALSLSACASTGEDYPSLAIRDVERAQGQFEPIPVEPIDVPNIPVNYEGSLEGRLATLTAQARAAHARFIRSEVVARRMVGLAGRAPVGSDNWGATQIALSDLESIRSDTAIALADLDILHIAASVAAEDRAQIDAARGSIIALVEEEDAALAELRSRITP